MADFSDARFKSLIQPIKDLASNWDIDIADSLTDYLEELEGLRITLDDGQTQLNFAEAALLIQGSAAVYSKKVEYLYQLVVQSIEFMTKKKSAVLTGTGRKGDDSSIDEDVLNFGSDPDFLLLDHVIEEGTNIDMKIPAGGQASRLSSDSILSASAMNMSHMSISLLHSALHDDQGGTSLKLASSHIDEHGAMVLGGYRAPFYQSAMLPAPASAPAAPAAAPSDDLQPAYDMDYGYEDAGDGGGYDDFGDMPLPPAAASAPQPKPSAHAPAPAAYVLLDPHQVIGGSRPAKKGRTYRLPRSLSAAPSGAPYDPNTELYSRRLLSDPWADFDMGKPSPGPLFSACLLPLLKASKTIQRRLAAKDRARRGLQPHDDHEEGHRQGHGQVDALMDMIYGPQPADAEEGVFPSLEDQVFDHYEEADYDMPAADDMDMGGGYADDEADLARRVDAAMQAEAEGDAYQHSYEQICKQFIENFHRGAEAFARESQLSKRVNDWTSRLEPILQAQEEARPFDIHVCSDALLDQLASQTKGKGKGGQKTMPFEALAAGEGSAEVCRRFLACLQLANLGNIEIQGAPPGRDVAIANDFTVKLLSDTRSNEIENFRAPSLVV